MLCIWTINPYVDGKTEQGVADGEGGGGGGGDVGADEAAAAVDRHEDLGEDDRDDRH